MGKVLVFKYLPIAPYHRDGDYMQLPPEDQRVTHHFEAYWR